MWAVARSSAVSVSMFCASIWLGTRLGRRVVVCASPQLLFSLVIALVLAAGALSVSWRMSGCPKVRRRPRGGGLVDWLERRDWLLVLW